MWRPWSVSRQRTSVSVSSANQSMRSPGDQIPALLIQPPRFVEVPTSGETVTTRSATSGASRTRSTKKRPNACWVEAVPLCSRPRSSGHARRVDDELRRAAVEPPRRGRAQLGLRRCRRRSVAHGILRVGAERLRELPVLLLVEQRGVVGRVALGRQPPALDRVGEHDRRAVAHRVGLAVAVEQRAEVVAAEVAERVQQLVVLEVVGDHLEPPPQLARVGAQQPLVLLVGHRVDALAQRLVGGELRPVLDHHAVPAGGLEHRREPPRRDVGHDAVERLAVEVDDPQDLAELRHHRVGDRLPARRPRRARRRRAARSGGRRPARRSGRPRSGARARPRSARWRRCRPSRSSSRPGRGPSRATGRTAARRTGAASPGSAARAARAGS